VQDKSANYSVVAADAGDLIRVTTTSGARTITLPAIAGTGIGDGFKIAIVKWTGDGNAVTVSRSSSDTINGATSYSLGNQYSSATFVADAETNQWFAAASGLGTTNANVDSFSGNGSTTAFTLSGDPGNENNTAVMISGVYQSKATYSVSGTTLTFSTAPPSGSSNIEVVWNSPLAIGVPSDATVTPAKLSTGGPYWNSSGNLGVGTTSPVSPLTAARGNVTGAGQWASSAIAVYNPTNIGSYSQIAFGYTTGTTNAAAYIGFVSTNQGSNGYGDLVFGTRAVNTDTQPTERARIDSSGNLLVGTTSLNFGLKGSAHYQTGLIEATVAGAACMNINRLTDDGILFGFYQASTLEGNISVSGTTVSYNGGHLARYAQTIEAKDESLKKGTVLSNLDEMNTYTDAEGNAVDNEQLNKVKVSDVEGDANVAGVFVNWSHDEDHNVDEINMAMTGDMIIRIAQGTTVARGDLLMSAGDGTAKPQNDDIVRAKTIAKVTSTHVTCTYEDGSYCVPCVLMAC